MKTSEEIRREIFRAYNKNPRGWHVIHCKDVKGYHNLIVTHGTHMWMIKEENINPYTTVGVGAKTTVEKPPFPSEDDIYTYGFRPIDQDQLQHALSMQEQEGSMEALLTILRKEPHAIHSMPTPGALEGPLLHSPRALEFISEKQQALESKLRTELNRLLQRDYSHIMRQYI